MNGGQTLPPRTPVSRHPPPPPQRYCTYIAASALNACVHYCLSFYLLILSNGHIFTALYSVQRVRLSVRNDRNVSVRPSVCLSVTSRYYVKTKKASVIISSPSGSPTILVFWCQISSGHYKVSPPRANKGGVCKIRSFLSLSLIISKTVVADTAKVTIND